MTAYNFLASTDSSYQVALPALARFGTERRPVPRRQVAETGRSGTFERWRYVGDGVATGLSDWP
jgi:hypothetical protein